MARLTPTQELDQLALLIARHPEGIDSESLLRQFGGALQLRTLQRRLAGLVEQGLISVQGQARAVRYFPAEQGIASTVTAALTDEAEAYVPVSAEGAYIKAYVRQ